ncbi:MAG: hypothetical protein ABSC90_13435 [Acidimicrobiales bacterium]|jgi:hypothetical protein
MNRTQADEKILEAQREADRLDRLEGILEVLEAATEVPFDFYGHEHPELHRQ